MFARIVALFFTDPPLPFPPTPFAVAPRVEEGARLVVTAGIWGVRAQTLWVRPGGCAWASAVPDAVNGFTDGVIVIRPADFLPFPGCPAAPPRFIVGDVLLTDVPLPPWYPGPELRVPVGVIRVDEAEAGVPIPALSEYAQMLAAGMLAAAGLLMAARRSG